MPLKWKLFRFACLLQMLVACFFTLTALINVIQSVSFSAFVRILLFMCIFLLTILAIHILNNNYPDVPVTGKQKTNFNRLFLINFLFLAFLFGIVFAEYREVQAWAALIDKSFFQLPFETFIGLLSSTCILVLQLIILYGLYELRRELYMNFMKKEFEFEKTQDLR
jgi:hypothetical protein